MAALLSIHSLSSSTASTSINLCFNSRFEASPTPRFHLFTGVDRGRKHDWRSEKKLFVALAVKDSEAIAHKTKKQKATGLRKRDNGLVLSEGRDEDEDYGSICPGCGVFMQDGDPNLPGYFQERKGEQLELIGDEDEIEGFDEFEGVGEDFDDDDDIEGALEDGEEDGIDWDSAEDWESEWEDEEEEYLKELDGFTPAGVGYSLRNYGQVKNQVAENLIPDFDFDRLISTRLMKPTGKADATVLVMVVDCVDFDGSFPKRAAKSLFSAFEMEKDGSKLGKNLPKLVLVATKVYLLPSQVSPTRLDRWVRHRAKANGAPKLSGVYLVSSRKDLGVRNLLAFIKDLAGPRGNVWVLGAQNAGKSTLINAFSKKQGVKVTKLTEAAVPGTTLGILRIGGILPAKAKMYDTPGLLHPYLLSTRLNRDEQKMVEIRKELQPRTFRIKAGQAIHIGGLVRLDLNEASVDTIYVTVFLSPSVSLHLGKTENADDTKSKHSGIRLQPPVGIDRVPELGGWVKKEIKACGASWEVNCMDVAVAGLGWFSLGLKGEANLSLWTYAGVQVSLREPLVLDRARSLERPGFWLPKAISDSIANQSKTESKLLKTAQEEDEEMLPNIHVSA